MYNTPILFTGVRKMSFKFSAYFYGFYYFGLFGKKGNSALCCG